MNIIGIFGLQGQGKTALGVAVARYIAACIGGVIYTNVKMDGAVRISLISEFPMDQSPKVLLVDEAMFSLDSRLFSEKSAVGWTQFIAFLRKTNTLLIYMTHAPRMVEVRLREQTAIAVFARRRGEAFEYTFFNQFTGEEGLWRMVRSDALWQFLGYDTYDFPWVVRFDHMALAGTRFEGVGFPAGR